MSVEIISEDGTELTLQMKVDLSGSMLSIEDKIQDACNEAGLVSTEVALQGFDTGGSDLVVGETKYTVRTRESNLPNALWSSENKTLRISNIRRR